MSNARLGNLVLAPIIVLALSACTRPNFSEQTIWQEHSTDGPVDIDAVVSKYPELDGVLISAPEYMEELEREKKRAEAEGTRIVGEPYVVQPSSVLMVEVPGHGEFTRQVLVGPDGTYDFPLIGVMNLQGKTLEQVRAELTEKLKRFIKNPQVSVNSSYIGAAGTVLSPSTHTGSITVVGAVSEGIYGYTGRETIRHIIALAGGVSDDAAWRDIRVIKQSPGRKRARIVIVDWFNLVKFGDLSQDIPLASGDIVYVPPHFPLGEHIQRDWDLIMKYASQSQSYDQLIQYFEGRLRGRIKPLRDANH
ncbi:MAG: polysaccharide biosynthesis/export family protein [Planctomycetota bacterium]|nr:polysaccharide biosynthesis/export family protein [Planctomycetota bacterium]